jgi:ABC transporter substrate binding protein
MVLGLDVSTTPLARADEVIESNGASTSVTHSAAPVIAAKSSQTGDPAAKRLELLRELIPGLHRLAIMANVDAPGAVLEVADVQAAARALGLEVVTSQIRRVQDIAPAVEALKGRADALLVPPEPLVFANRIRINILAASARLPTMYGSREYVEAGGLMSYGPNFSGSVSACRRLGRQDFAWGEARRQPGRAADQV